MSVRQANNVSEAIAARQAPADGSAVSLEQQPVAAGLGGKRRILAAFAQLGLMRIAVSFSGLARNKVLAVCLKPAGFGEFTQLLNIAEVVNVFVQFGTTVGLSRNVAAAGTSKEQQRQLETANFLVVSLALATLALIVPLLLSATGSMLLVKLGISPGFRQKAILLALFSIAPIEALRNNYLSFLAGLVDIKGISSKRSLAVIATTAVAVPLVLFFGIVGACVQTALASLFLAFLLGLRCRQRGFKPLSILLHKDAARLLMTLGTASLVSGFALNSTDTLIRAYLISHWGQSENGLYQAALALCSQVTAVILASIGTYSIGTLSQTRDPKTLTLLVEELLRVVLPLSTISLGLVGLLSRPLFSILFSSQFHAGSRFLPLLLSSSYLQASAWVVGAPLLGCGLIRTWTAIQLAGAVLRYGTVFLCSPVLGMYSVPGGLLAAMLFDLALNIIFCRRPIGIRLKPQTVLSMVVGALAVVTAAAVGCSGAGWSVCLLSAFLLCLIGIAMVWTEASAAFRKFALQ